MTVTRAIRQILRQPPESASPLSLLPAIAAGLVIFVVMSGVPLALGFVSYGLGMGVLAILAVCGLWLGYRSGFLSVLGAVFVALLPAALAVGGADDLREAGRTAVAAISISDAPRQTDARVLLLEDARVATEFTFTWTSRPPAGGPDRHHAMAPLVPRDWRRDQPVPAWRVCTGGDAEWCGRALGHPVRAVRRLSDAESVPYRPAVTGLERRFDLTSAPGAPLLQLATPPAERARAAVTGMMLMPILGFAVWSLGLLAWRGASRLRGRAG